MILFSNKDDIAFCESLREANSLVVELTTAGADARMFTGYRRSASKERGPES